MRITVRVRPGSSRTRVGGRYGDAPGTPSTARVSVSPSPSRAGDLRAAEPEEQDLGVLVVHVAARAVDGAATAAVLDAVAEAFGLRRRQVSLVSGATSRTKVLDLDLDAAVGERRLAHLLQA